MVDVRETYPRILIVCEGEKTEPNYFRGFRLPSVVIRGLGRDPNSLVEYACTLRDEDGDYDQVWCVFDHDLVSADDFNAAINKARRFGMSVAYSNEAFELWFCLHFDYYNSGLTRQDYPGILSDHLGRPYKKNDTNMFRDLEKLQEAALRNARRLLNQYSPPNPARDNPSTTVHLLVDELNRISKTPTESGRKMAHP